MGFAERDEGVGLKHRLFAGARRVADWVVPVEFRQWILIGGNRRVVTGLLLGLTFGSLLLSGHVQVFDLRALLTERNVIQSLFETLLSGVMLLVSIVVSINSLVVSQELTPIGDQHERVVKSWAFREEASRLTDDGFSPAHPLRFLTTIIQAADREMATLESYAETLEEQEETEEVRSEIQSCVEQARAGIEETEQAMGDPNYETISAAIFGSNYDVSAYIDAVRSMKTGHRSVLDDEVEEVIENVVSALQYFSTAREYFKTVYYKREFSYLSRDLLYSGLPAILVISYVLLAINEKSFAGSTLGVNHLVFVFSGVYTLSLAPFLVLTSYAIRAAVIAHKTVTTSAFSLE